MISNLHFVRTCLRNHNFNLGLIVPTEPKLASVSGIDRRGTIYACERNPRHWPGKFPARQRRLSSAKGVLKFNKPQRIIMKVCG